MTSNRFAHQAATQVLIMCTDCTFIGKVNRYECCFSTEHAVAIKLVIKLIGVKSKYIHLLRISIGQNHISCSNILLHNDLRMLHNNLRKATIEELQIYKDLHGCEHLT